MTRAGTTPLVVFAVLAACASDDPADAAGTTTAIADGGSTIGGDDGVTSGPTGTGDGATTSSPVDGSETGTSMGTMSATDTGPGPECTGHGDCTDPSAPICEGEVCIPCHAASDPDGACAEADPQLPVCAAGTCVECLPGNAASCTGTTPVCDADALSCRGCTEHVQCPASACHIPDPERPVPEDGACFDEANVVHVHGDGTVATASTAIGAALNGFAPGSEGVLVIHETTPSYNQPVTITGDRVIAILGAEGESPYWSQSSVNGGPHLTITGAGTILFLHRMELRGNAGNDPAIRVGAGRLHAQRSRMGQSFGGGGGAVAEAGALAHAENCFLGGGADAIALSVQTSTARILDSTLVGGPVAVGTPAALTCNAPAGVVVHNSVLVSVSSEAEILCTGADVTYSATEAGFGGTGNEAVGNAQFVAWFVDPAAGDFHLTAAGDAVFADIAQWQAGDPLVDLDGDPRPGTDGAADYAGADVS